jgi:hypothetical protein
VELQKLALLLAFTDQNGTSNPPEKCGPAWQKKIGYERISTRDFAGGQNSKNSSCQDKNPGKEEFFTL